MVPAMKLFACPHCRNRIYFENTVCLNCKNAVLYDPAEREFVLAAHSAGWLLTRACTRAKSRGSQVMWCAARQHRTATFGPGRSGPTVTDATT